MKRGEPRSTDVTETLVAPAREAPREAEIAFEELYRSSRNDLFAYVAGLLRDRGAAEDVTALAFERAYRRRSSFDPKRGSRRAWLFGIARNAALDELRRRGRHAELAVEPEDVDATPPTRSTCAPAAAAPSSSFDCRPSARSAFPPERGSV
jgi:RNA polymerase sigma-70 factor (ECF subfamily)